MPKGIYQIPMPVNEPVKSYAPGSKEREELIAAYNALYNSAPIDVPMYIGGEEVRTNNKIKLSPPHEHAKVIGFGNLGDATHVSAAIDAALAARQRWANLPWEHLLESCRPFGWPISCKNQCRHDAWTVEKCLPSRNRLCL